MRRKVARLLHRWCNQDPPTNYKAAKKLWQQLSHHQRGALRVHLNSDVVPDKKDA